MEKECFKCLKTKPLTEFYKHPRMADGHLNKCKDCARRDAMNNRKKKADYYREFDRKRSMLPHRVSSRRMYLETEKGKEAKKKSIENYVSRNPEKMFAVVTLNNAVRGKRVFKPKHCSQCGEKSKYIHGHHEDYSEPLDVVWLCPACHKKVHREERKTEKQHALFFTNSFDSICTH